MIGRESGTSSKELRPNQSPEGVCAELRTQLNDIQGEPPGPFPELIPDHARPTKQGPDQRADSVSQEFGSQ